MDFLTKLMIGCIRVRDDLSPWQRGCSVGSWHPCFTRLKRSRNRHYYLNLYTRLLRTMFNNRTKVRIIEKRWLHGRTKARTTQADRDIYRVSDRIPSRAGISVKQTIRIPDSIPSRFCQEALQTLTFAVDRGVKFSIAFLPSA